MLVLSRRVNEEIIIGNDIRIIVIEVKGGRVRIGIKAPESVTIRRGETETLVEKVYE